MAAETLGYQASDLHDHWVSVSHAVYSLSGFTEEQPWSIHQKTLYQVYLPHSIISDLPLHASPGFSAHHQNRPPCTGASPNCCGMDDIALGPR